MNNYEIQLQQSGEWQTQVSGEAKSRRAFIKENKYKQEHRKKTGTQTRVVKV